MNYREEFLNRCMVVDTETTNIDAKIADIIEFGYALRSEGDWVTVDQLYKPSQSISPMVSSITHITDRHVAECFTFPARIDDDLHAIMDAVGEDVILVAHNALYDRTVFENYAFNAPKTPWICTLKIARKLYGEDESVENLKLGYLRYRFDLTVPEGMQEHRAGFDAYMDAKLLEFFLDKLEEDGIIDKDQPYYDQLIAWQETPILLTKMTLGKHKGKLLEEVPMSYWKWALSNMDLLNEEHESYDADFAHSVTVAIEKILDL